jgi:hypothetical protein
MSVAVFDVCICRSFAHGPGQFLRSEGCWRSGIDLDSDLSAAAGDGLPCFLGPAVGIGFPRVARTHFDHAGRRYIEWSRRGVIVDAAVAARFGRVVRRV